jgi:hypothetical protein
MVASLPGAASSATGRLTAHPLAQEDGPFGIAMGEPLSKLGKLEPTAGGYHVLSPPRPSPDIIFVTVEGYAATGVCSISGVSDVNEDDPNAVAAKQFVDQLAGVLQSKYGAATGKIDQCTDGNSVCSQFLTQAIQDGSANYAYGWSLKGPRPDHIRAVELFVHALSALKTVAVVHYLSDNSEACEAAKNASAASAY